MNPDRQQSLLRAARRMPPVPPPEHFCAEVLRTIQRNDPAAASPGSVFAVLDGWFPRLALAAGLIILAMWVFGSVARGGERPDSDIDFLVKMAPERSLLDMGGLQMDLEEMLGQRIDVVTRKGLDRRYRSRILREIKAL